MFHDVILSQQQIIPAVQCTAHNSSLYWSHSASVGLFVYFCFSLCVSFLAWHWTRLIHFPFGMSSHVHTFSNSGFNVSCFSFCHSVVSECVLFSVCPLGCGFSYALIAFWKVAFYFVSIAWSVWKLFCSVTHWYVVNNVCFVTLDSYGMSFFLFI